MRALVAARIVAAAWAVVAGTSCAVTTETMYCEAPPSDGSPCPTKKVWTQSTCGDVELHWKVVDGPVLYQQKCCYLVATPFDSEACGGRPLIVAGLRFTAALARGTAWS